MLAGGALWVGHLCLQRASSPTTVDYVANVLRLDAQEEPGPLLGRDALGQRFREGRIIAGDTPHRLILFSFDDGPDRHLTPRLLDRLDEVGVRALFFLTAARLAGTGPAAQARRAVARDMAQRGHLLGSHTLDHAQLTLLSNEDVLAQLMDAAIVFEGVFGQTPVLFRPPGGAHSPRIDRLTAAAGYTTVLWNLGTGDTQVRTAQEVFEIWQRVLKRREREQGVRGGIVLLHDIHPWSIAAFELIVDELLRRNCTLLDTGEELYDLVDDPRWFFEPRHNPWSGHRADPSTFAAEARIDPQALQARQRLLRKRTRDRCQPTPSQPS